MSDKAPTFLFDLDGTLVDSAPDLVAAINETRRDEGLSPVPYEAIRIYASKGAPGLLRAAYGIERDDPPLRTVENAFCATTATRASRARNSIRASKKCSVR